MSDISRLMRKRFDVTARSVGVTGAQWRVLLFLARRPGVNQGQIAEYLDVEPITTCRMIDRLEQAGLVERRCDPLDRRAWQIFATEAAVPLLGRLHDISEDLAEASQTGLTAVEIETLRGLLDRVRGNIAGDPADGRPADRRPAVSEAHCG